MANNGITAEMYNSLQFTINLYKDKVAKQGYQSLTQDDIASLKNIGSVLNLLRFTALKEIVKSAVQGNYSKVIEYYSQKEQNFLDGIIELQDKLEEVSAKIVESISRGDIANSQIYTSEYDKIKSEMAEKKKIYEDFVNSQLKPEDFVKQILGQEGNELVREAVREIVGTSQYLLKPSFNSEQSTLYSFPNDGEVVIDENLVQLTIDYLNGNESDIENLSRLDEHIEFLNMLNHSSPDFNALIRTHDQYLKLMEARNNLIESVEKAEQSRLRIFKTSSNRRRKEYVEKCVKDINLRLGNLKDDANSYYDDFAKILKEKNPGFVSFEDIFLNENFNSFVLRIRDEYESRVNAQKNEILRKIEELKTKIKPEYSKLNPSDIKRITYYGRGRLETTEFKNMSTNLELLSIISKAQKGVQNPTNILSGDDVSRYEAEALTAVEEEISSMKM